MKNRKGLNLTEEFCQVPYLNEIKNLVAKIVKSKE
jgi:hypothetical protein